MSFTVLSGECLFDRHIIGSDRFGYGLERHLTVPNVQTLRKMHVALQSFLPAEVGDAQRVRQGDVVQRIGAGARDRAGHRSEEHTSELQSLMRRSYAVFCLKTKKETKHNRTG